MNEPWGWTFLCIWYESRGFWVHELKRPCFSFYMALCIPIHLRQRTSRAYQDHLHFCRVLTSFVPPVHNQGVSLAPLQGRALWNIFLPTTGSFFCIKSYWPVLYESRTAPCGGRFPDSLFIPFSFPVTAEFNSLQLLLKAQFNRNRVLPVFFLLVMLSTSAVSWCLPSVSPHHNSHLLSVSRRIPLESCMPLLLPTASSLMGSLCGFGSTHESPWTQHSSLPMISPLHTVHISAVSCLCSWSGFLHYAFRNHLPRLHILPASAVA